MKKIIRKACTDYQLDLLTDKYIDRLLTTLSICYIVIKPLDR